MRKEVLDLAREMAKRLAPVYQFLHWKWTANERVPTEEDIFYEFVSLHLCLSSGPLEGSADSMSTGGLEVYRWRDEEGFIHYKFRFVIEERLDLGNSLTDMVLKIH